MITALAPLPCDRTATRESMFERAGMPVLIQVPALRITARRRARRRRRLRREVRLGGLVALVGTPLLALSAWIPGAARPQSAGTGPPVAAVPAHEPPMVCLLPTLEPVPAPPVGDPGRAADENWVDAWDRAHVPAEPATVRMPAYLLPELPVMGGETGSEEPPHAGT